MEDSQKLQLYEEISSHVTDHVMAGIEEITGQRGEHYIRVLYFSIFIPNTEDEQNDYFKLLIFLSWYKI